jgi:uncharacterized protein YmfQ (DUF2313 family)
MSSFIDEIQIIIDKQQSFVANSQEENAQSLADYLPNGALYLAKNLENTNFRKMLSSLALELIRKENVLETTADEYYPFLTANFLEEWEAALNIPDDCFTVVNTPIDQRRRQIVAKLAIDNIINKEDFIALARFFGFEISISSGFGASTFPMTFPAILGGETLESKFTMVVTFKDEVSTDVFPYTFPMTFPTIPPRDFLECLIIKLAPANVRVVFKTQS